MILKNLRSLIIHNVQSFVQRVFVVVVAAVVLTTRPDSYNSTVVLLMKFLLVNLPKFS